jgi:hypothetical protein
MADKKTKIYMVKGVPTDAQINQMVDQLMADAKAQKAALKEARKQKD